MRGDEVGERPRFLQVRGGGRERIGEQRRQPHQIDEEGERVAPQGLGLWPRRGNFAERLHACHEVRVLLHDLHDPDARETLDHEVGVAVRPGRELHDAGRRPDGVQVRRAGVLRRAAHGEQTEDTVRRAQVRDQPQRSRLAHADRRDHEREDHRPLERQHGDAVGQSGRGRFLV